MLDWSIKLFRVFRIPLELHISFFIIPLYFAMGGWQAGRWDGVYWSIATCGMIFTCVVLHELGHALTAKRFGIEMDRILLLPFGGIAQFLCLPQTASRELLVTFAGPSVNFALVLLLWPFMTQRPDLNHIPSTAQAMLNYAVYFNAIMGLFNLIPVFPMDGGRLLRAGLTYKLGYKKATLITARLGTFLAVAAATYAAIGLNNFHLAALFTFVAIASRVELKGSELPEEESPKETDA